MIEIYMRVRDTEKTPGTLVEVNSTVPPEGNLRSVFVQMANAASVALPGGKQVSVMREMALRNIPPPTPAEESVTRR